MRKHRDLQNSVLETIKWEPLLAEAEIYVTQKDGVITLTGTVDSYVKKLGAICAAKSVAGVKDVVEKIEIKLDGSSVKSDNDITAEVLKTLQGNWIVLKKKVKVENGWVTIEGQMTWNYQKEALKRSINNIIGVKGVTFRINIKSECRDEIEKQTIKSAFARNWSINDLDIEIVILGDKVTLSGRVNSWDDREEAERLTWNAPGVCIVDNELVVNYDYLLGD